MNQLDIHDDYFDFEREIIPLVPRANYASASEALEYLLNEFYNSANDISKQQITETFAYLCDCLNVSDELLQFEDGLCVVHWKKAKPQSEIFDFWSDITRQHYNTKGK